MKQFLTICALTLTACGSNQAPETVSPAALTPVVHEQKDRHYSKADNLRDFQEYMDGYAERMVVQRDPRDQRRDPILNRNTRLNELKKPETMEVRYVTIDFDDRKVFVSRLDFDNDGTDDYAFLVGRKGDDCMSQATQSYPHSIPCHVRADDGEYTIVDYGKAKKSGQMYGLPDVIQPFEKNALGENRKVLPDATQTGFGNAVFDGSIAKIANMKRDLAKY